MFIHPSKIYDKFVVLFESLKESVRINIFCAYAGISVNAVQFLKIFVDSNATLRNPSGIFFNDVLLAKEFPNTTNDELGILIVSKGYSVIDEQFKNALFKLIPEFSLNRNLGNADNNSQSIKPLFN